ncbi:unnamed protein product, partial [Ectocarpus sp. 6 AP-2014]
EPEAQQAVTTPTRMRSTRPNSPLAGGPTRARVRRGNGSRPRGGRRQLHCTIVLGVVYSPVRCNVCVTLQRRSDRDPSSGSLQAWDSRRARRQRPDTPSSCLSRRRRWLGPPSPAGWSRSRRSRLPGELAFGSGRCHGEPGMSATLDSGRKRRQQRQQSRRHTATPCGAARQYMCVNALVEGGAQFSRRNTLGFTPREDLLHSEPMFARGRLPKVLRATLAYIQDAEASAPQPQSPTWTAQDGYGSGGTPATVVSSRRSPIGGPSRHAFDIYFNSGPEPPSEGEGPLQQIDTASASGKETEALHYYRHHAKGRAHATVTDRLKRNRDWDLRELQGSGNVLEGRNEDKTFSNGSRRGNCNRLVPVSVVLDWATDPLFG